MDFLSKAYDLVAAEFGIDRALLKPLEIQLRESDGKDRHYIASASAYRETEQIEKIFAAFRAGLGSREIAERIGISQRTVQRVIARHPMP